MLAREAGTQLEWPRFAGPAQVAPTRPMVIVAGTKLGRYEIRSKIGEGGMGEAYLVQDAPIFFVAEQR